MTAKEFLQQAYIAHGEIEATLEEINRIQTVATQTTTTLKSTPCGGNDNGSKIENSVVAIQEKVDSLADSISKYLSVSEKIENAIAQVGNFNERRILKYRYLCFFSWQQIAWIVKLSVRQTLRLHDQALEKIFSMSLDVT